MNIALIMMGGKGTRFGSDIPKQFVEVENVPVFLYLVEAYQQFKEVDKIVIVCHEDWKDFTRSWCRDKKISKLCDVVSGGANRSHSVQNGLDRISRIAENDDVVLVHDVTHPFIDKENVVECILFAREDGAATLAGSCFDTMYQLNTDDVIERVVNRESLVSATAPECFRFDVIWPLYDGKTVEDLEKMTSAGAMLVANGKKVRVIRTPLINLKITLHEDMEAFKKLLHGYYYE